MNAQYLNNSIGLVLCGGKSSRMSADKSQLKYFEKAQSHHVYSILQSICEKTFISCNANQVKNIEKEFNYILDENSYSNIGPMAGLLSAFAMFPHNDLLVIGCDYPFLDANELQQFVKICKSSPASFYNESANVFEPMLAWYPSSSYPILKDMYNASQFSLQKFLTDIKAYKYYPKNKHAIISVDTPEDFSFTITKLRE